MTAAKNLDMHRSWRVTVENPNARILGEILIAANNRVYIVEGETPLNVPPAAQFQASIQVLNNEGVRIRTRTEIAAPAEEKANVGAAFNQAEATRVATAASGTWRNPSGGSCEAAYFKSGMRGKTKRDEEALSGTVTNQGTTIAGQLVIVGAARRTVRRRQRPSDLPVREQAGRQADVHTDRRTCGQLAGSHAGTLPGKPRLTAPKCEVREGPAPSAGPSAILRPLCYKAGNNNTR